MEQSNTIEKIQQKFINQFVENKALLNNHTGQKINSKREKAFEIFKISGIPTKKNEAYRYTNLEIAFSKQYETEFFAENIKIDLREVFKCEVPELDTHVILVLNGFYYSYNQFNELPEGIIICSLAEASQKYSKLFNLHYGEYADDSKDSICALNTMYTQDGVFIYLPEKSKLMKPLQIINLCYSFNNLQINCRNLIIAEKNTSSQIIVCDHTLCERSYLTNYLTEIYAGENASLDYNYLQNENNISSKLSNLYIHQEKKSNVTNNTLTLHGGFVRNNVFVNLKGEGAANQSYGLYLCDDHQHVTNYTFINHLVPNCTSNQLYKGIIDNYAIGAFNGKILVNRDAQKTEAYQRNNNILLSKTARANSKPLLEIYADDVKCSHGATIGQLNDDALFYIKSRGIGEKEARHLLMYAFTNDIIAKIQNEHIRIRITNMVNKRLRGELSRCQNCEVRCG